MTTLSTHVLDMATGSPASDMRVHLARAGEGGWETIDELVTDDQGRVAGFGELTTGRYRMGFETAEYGNDFFPFIHVVFEIDGTTDHYHVPLLLSPYGYSTYRGS